MLRDGPATQREVADHLQVTPRNVTGLVDALVDGGHLVRRPHPTDRRATLVDLTAQGRAKVESMVEGYAEMHEVLFGGLSERQLAAFGRTLDMVLARLRTRVQEEWG